jgi:hypothetical protein
VEPTKVDEYAVFCENPSNLFIVDVANILKLAVDVIVIDPVIFEMVKLIVCADAVKIADVRAENRLVEL